MPKSDKRKQVQSETLLPERNDRWQRQLAGAVIGALVLWGLGQFGLWAETEPGALLLWGGAIGALLAGSEGLVRAGGKLTGHEADSARWRWINGLVSLVALWVFVGLLMVVAHFISAILGLT